MPDLDHKIDLRQLTPVVFIDRTYIFKSKEVNFENSISLLKLRKSTRKTLRRSCAYFDIRFLEKT